MKRKTDNQLRPGTLAATLRLFANHDRQSPLRLQHQVTCASRQDRACDCYASLTPDITHSPIPLIQSGTTAHSSNDAACSQIQSGTDSDVCRFGIGRKPSNGAGCAVVPDETGVSRTTIEYRLSERPEGWATLVGHSGETFDELHASLKNRFGNRLLEVRQ